MPTKTCFKCKLTLPIESFYRHPRMADGRLNKCKDCAKFDVKLNYRVRIEKYTEYERARAQRPERKANMYKYTKTRRALNPLKYKAYSAVSKAVRDGRLVKKPCMECGSSTRVEAHHRDYSKPLDVMWLCFDCHRTEEHSDIYNVQASRVVVEKK